MTKQDFDYEAIRARAMHSLFESLDSISEGTLVVDRDARVVWINERYALRFGLRSAADAIGREVESIIPGSLMREVVRTGQPILLDILDTGEESFVVTRIPLKDDAGSIIGAVGFALFDNTEALKTFYARLGGMQRELAQTRRRLDEARRTRYTFSHFIGSGATVMELKRRARRAAATGAPVLLLGETGTGKELLAQAIHAASARADKPFIAVNMAAVPEALLEAEFFGTEPGAFTGADRKPRPGKFQLADGGTLFLDEIGDMPPTLQAKLLRVLQEHEIEPLGSNRVHKVDVRIIAATSVDLAKRIEAGSFRSDLYYRLAVLPLTLPPLRERLEDLEALCEHILEELARGPTGMHRELRPDALALLRACAWPGNVRQLRNVLERAVMLADNPRIGASDLHDLVDALPDTARKTTVRPLAETVADCERRAIAEALVNAEGRAVEAARALGVGRATLYKKMSALGISPTSKVSE